MNYIKMKYENLSFLTRGKYSSIDELNQVNLIQTVKIAMYILTLYPGAIKEYLKGNDYALFTSVGNSNKTITCQDKTLIRL